MNLLIGGWTDEEAARILGVAYRTVRVRLLSIHSKLGAFTPEHATAMYLEAYPITKEQS